MYASASKQSMTDEVGASNAAARCSASSSEPSESQESAASSLSTLQRSNLQNAASTKKNSRHPPPSRLLLPPSASPPGLPPPETPILPAHHSRRSHQSQLGRSSLGAEAPQYSSPRKAPEPPRRPARSSSEFSLPTIVSKPTSAIARDIVTRFERERSPARRASRKKSMQRNDLSILRNEQWRFEIPLGRTQLAANSLDDKKTMENSPSHALSRVRQNGGAPAQTSFTTASYGAAIPTSALNVAHDNQPDLPLLSRKKAGATSGVAGMSRISTGPPDIDGADSALNDATGDATTPNPFSRKRGTISRTKAERRSLDTQSTHFGGTQRSILGSSIRASPSDHNDSVRIKINPDAITKSIRPDTQAMRSRSLKSEAMSMLMDSKFLSEQEMVHFGATKPSKLRTSRMYRVNLPPRLSFLGSTLPNTPLSSQSTPTEMYRYSPASPRRSLNTFNRRPGMTARSPFGLVSRNPQSPKSRDNRSQYADYFGRQRDQHSPNEQLRAIPENGIGIGSDENAVSPSAVNTPMATRIQVRGGSVVIVAPPELTAWKPAIYIPGPIMLLKPAIVPRKNSVASLEAFDDCIDQMYQDALAVPRRRSDDAVVDDIVDFFDDFEFDVVSFGGDVIKALSIDVSEQHEEDEERVSQQFSTPPAEMPIADLRPRVPPVETEETLRAKGIARLSRMSAESAQQKDAAGRRESMVLGQGEGQAKVPMCLAPEESVLETVCSPSLVGNTKDSSMQNTASVFSVNTATASTVEQGFDWNDGPEEISASSSWVAPAVAPKGPGFHKSLLEPAKKSRNPIHRIRKLAATASTVL